MLIEHYAPQYGIPCVFVEDLAIDPDAAINFAKEIGAVREVDGVEFCVQLPGRPQELYTESALRRSFKPQPESPKFVRVEATTQNPKFSPGVRAWGCIVLLSAGEERWAIKEDGSDEINPHWAVGCWKEVS